MYFNLETCQVADMPMFKGFPALRSFAGIPVLRVPLGAEYSSAWPGRRRDLPKGSDVLRRYVAPRFFSVDPSGCFEAERAGAADPAWHR